MSKNSLLLLSILLLTIQAQTSNTKIHKQELIIHETCKKTHMPNHCIQAIHSYNLFKYTNHSTPLQIASILIYLTGMHQAISTLNRVDELISSSRRESKTYVEVLKVCKENYKRIYDTDYFNAWVSLKNGNFKVAENAMWSCGERAESCERGFDRVGKYPIVDLNDKLRVLAMIAAQVLRSLE